MIGKQTRFSPENQNDAPGPTKYDSYNDNTIKHSLERSLKLFPTFGRATKFPPNSYITFVPGPGTYGNTMGKTLGGNQISIPKVYLALNRV